MIVTAGEQIEGYKIVEYKDIVFGMASSSEGVGYRQTALKKVGMAAENIGANAITNFNMQIYQISDKVQEATAYGNAVVVLPIEGYTSSAGALTEAHKVDINSFIPKSYVKKSEIAKIQEANGYKFVTCPKCGTKYKIDVNEKGEIHIKGFEDVDDEEAGLQIYCLRCGTKFTVPDSL
jgi:uncharacterized protein YbjQ (UPF0145 family)